MTGVVVDPGLHHVAASIDHPLLRVLLGEPPAAPVLGFLEDSTHGPHPVPACHPRRPRFHCLLLGAVGERNLHACIVERSPPSLRLVFLGRDVLEAPYPAR